MQFADLPIAEQRQWQGLLFSASTLAPRNASYYLSGKAQADPAEEYEAVRRALSGEIKFDGPPDQAPWCRFPARFFFAARTAYGHFLRPEDLRACNLPLPALDLPLDAYLQQHYERQDTGQALFHIDLLIKGSRFHNGSALTLKLRFGATQLPAIDALRHLPRPLVEAAQLSRAFFFASGRATVSKDVLLERVAPGDEGGQQLLRVPLAATQIYQLALLGIESMGADFPYDLRRANCHTYIEHLLRTVLPPSADGTRPLFDYLPDFADRYHADADMTPATLFAPHRYRPSLRREIATAAEALPWADYRILQSFLDEQTLPPVATLDSPALRLALGKAASLYPDMLRQSADLLALHDEYLQALADTAPAEPATAPGDKNLMPLFTSPHPSALSLGLSVRDGENWLHAALAGFATTAERLPGATPYGFTLLQFELLANAERVLLDRVLIVEQNKLGAACCGEALYDAGFRRLSGIALNLVNAPQARRLAKAGFKPELELKLTEGLGTAPMQGFSLQVLPMIDILSYGTHIDAGVATHAGWSSPQLAVSARRYFRLSKDIWRRDTARSALWLDVRLNDRARLEVRHERFDTDIRQTGLHFVHAF